MQTFKKAFTLAEILITLLIIGVIASLTIPGLISDTQDQQYKAAWRKTYSDLDQATKRIMTDNGGSLSGVCSETIGMDRCACIRDKLTNYLNYVKTCNYGASGCFHQHGGDFKKLSGDPFYSPSSSWVCGTGLVLNNGTLIDIDYWSDVWTASNPYVYIMVDINGSKGPNTVGKDIFAINLYAQYIKPFGSQNDGYENSCASNGSGLGCSAKFLYQ